jgi:hypothetical protein
MPHNVAVNGSARFCGIGCVSVSYCTNGPLRDHRYDFYFSFNFLSKLENLLEIFARFFKKLIFFLNFNLKRKNLKFSEFSAISTWTLTFTDILSQHLFTFLHLLALLRKSENKELAMLHMKHIYIQSKTVQLIIDRLRRGLNFRAPHVYTY